MAHGDDADNEQNTGVDNGDDVSTVVDARHDDVTTEDTPLADAMDAKYGPRTGAHNLRPRKQPSFAHLHTIAHTAEDVPSESTATYRCP